MAKNLMFTEMRDRKTAQKLFKDTESERSYTEVHGGFSWPSPAAFICVVAQEQKTGTLYVVHEDYRDNIVDLVRSLATLQSLYHVRDGWIAPTEGLYGTYVNLFYDTCRGLDLDQANLYVYQPHLAFDFNLSLQLIKKLFTLNTLKVPKGGILETKLSEVNNVDLREPDLEARFPEILTLASVCYAFPSPEDYQERRRRMDPYEKEANRQKNKSWMAA